MRSATGQGVPAAQSGDGATDAGAGNSGIKSTQEGLGGASSYGNSQSGTTQSGPNGQDMGNTAKP
jgi:hypothetical protein